MHMTVISCILGCTSSNDLTLHLRPAIETPIQHLYTSKKILAWKRRAAWIFHRETPFSYLQSFTKKKQGGGGGWSKCFKWWDQPSSIRCRAVVWPISQTTRITGSWNKRCWFSCSGVHSAGKPCIPAFWIPQTIHPNTVAHQAKTRQQRQHILTKPVPLQDSAFRHPANIAQDSLGILIKSLKSHPASEISGSKSQWVSMGMCQILGYHLGIQFALGCVPGRMVVRFWG